MASQPLGRDLLQINYEAREERMRRDESRSRSGSRIELLNARWHPHRRSPGFGRCAVCGSHVSEAAAAVYRDGEVLHADCIHYRLEPT
jgi:hypothetical protein